VINMLPAADWSRWSDKVSALQHREREAQHLFGRQPAHWERIDVAWKKVIVAGHSQCQGRRAAKIANQLLPSCYFSKELSTQNRIPKLSP